MVGEDAVVRAFWVGLVFAGAVLGWLLYAVYVPFGPSGEVFVDVPSGTGTAGMARLLESRGVIRSAIAFEGLRAWKGGRLEAGEYRFDHPARATEVYARLQRGDVFTRTLVIPEGYNIFDVARAVAAAGLGSEAEFLAAEREHVELIRAWVPPGVRPGSVEGFLFPDTYRFSRKATPEQMLEVMVRRFRQVAGQIGLRADVWRVVTTASLVEREVAVAGERGMVAGVFRNRMGRGMPLQTDPSVMYAAMLEGRYRGTIYASDLRSESPYNTYRQVGLPPGPIANPGLASLRAAMTPAETDALYFVSDGAGHSRFSATLAEHAAQVEAYRRGMRERP